MSGRLAEFQLKVWEGHQLARATYQATKGFPKKEQYKLINQVQCSAYSIPTNIAEGCGGRTDTDYSSCTLLWDRPTSLSTNGLAPNLGYSQEQAYQALNERVILVKKMPITLIGKLDP